MSHGDDRTIRLPRNAMALIREALSVASRSDVILSDASIRSLRGYVDGHLEQEHPCLPDELTVAAATVLSAAQLHQSAYMDGYGRLAQYISGNVVESDARRYGSVGSYIEAGRFRNRTHIRWWRRYFEDDVITGSDMRDVVEGLRHECAWLQELPVNQKRSGLAVHVFLERDFVPLLKAMVMNADKVTRHAVDEMMTFVRKDGPVLQNLARMSASTDMLYHAMTSAEVVLRGIAILNDSLGRMHVEWFDRQTLMLARAIMPDGDLDDEQRQVMVEGCLLGIGIVRTHGRAAVDVLGASGVRIDIAEASNDAALAANVVRYLDRMTVFIGDPVSEYARLVILIRAVRSATRMIGLGDDGGIYSVQDLDDILMRTRTMLNELRLRMIGDRTPPDRPPGTPRGGGTRKYRSGITSAVFDGGGGYSKGPTPAARLHMLQRYVQSWRGL